MHLRFTQAVVLSAQDRCRRREHARHIAASSALTLPTGEQELNAVVAGYARIQRTSGTQSGPVLIGSQPQAGRPTVQSGSRALGGD
jgi:hypothetical protein